MVMTNPKKIQYSVDINHIMVDKSSAITTVNGTTGTQTKATSANLTYNFTVPLSLPRNISAGGVKPVKIIVHHKNTGAAVTSITPTVWRKTLKANGADPTLLNLDIEAVTAFAVATSTAVARAEYKIPDAKQQYDSVGVNGATTYKVAENEVPVYGANLAVVTGGASKVFTLHGVTVEYEIV